VAVGFGQDGSLRVRRSDGTEAVLRGTLACLASSFTLYVSLSATLASVRGNGLGQQIGVADRLLQARRCQSARRAQRSLERRDDFSVCLSVRARGLFCYTLPRNAMKGGGGGGLLDRRVLGSARLDLVTQCTIHALLGASQ
jgi:hypothetical protein